VNYVLIGALALATGSALCAGQGSEDIQIHGFATQGFVVSNNNNYLGMDTRSGSPAWTEAAININDQVENKLRVGLQIHYTRLGTFGGDNVSVDWALGDYKIKPWFGIRTGKVKIRWGLLNDTQDYDPGYLWALLPESIYGVDVRATNLSQLGAEVYGKTSLGRKLGRLSYSGYYGYYFFSSDDGYMALFNAAGYTFPNPPGGKTPGFDLRWGTPLPGLELGGSLMLYNANGSMTNGDYKMPLTYWPTYYVQLNRKKIFTSAQYTKLVQYQTFSVTDSSPSTSGSDTRAWFLMGGYHFTDKLQAGAYYTHDLQPSGGDNSNPANFYNDWVGSGRFDLNSNFYMKLEGHLMDGNLVGFYSFDNPNGFKPRSRLLVAKIGFTF
jgi:hypothetical protein